MKKLIIFLLPLIVLTASAQVTQQKSWTLQASCAQLITVGDSAVIQAILTATDGVSYVSWKADSTVKLPTAINSYSASGPPYSSMLSTLTLKNLPVGKYTFVASGGSASGVNGSASTTLTVVAKVACPAIPAPRLATSVTIMVGGISVTIPASALKIAYADGSTQ